MKINLPEGSIDIDFDSTVYSPERTSVGTIILGNLLAKDKFTVVDVGCGSGVLGLALKKLNPSLDVILADVDPAARLQSQTNANLNLLNVKVVDSNLLSNISTADVVVANLPTYDKSQLKKETLYGPKIAYQGKGDDGFELIEDLLIQCIDKLSPGGYVILECQERLQPKLKLCSESLGFHLITRTDQSFAFVNPKR